MNGKQINVLHSAKYAFVYDVLVFALLIVKGAWATAVIDRRVYVCLKLI